jgi:hypothetical protein
MFCCPYIAEQHADHSPGPFFPLYRGVHTANSHDDRQPRILSAIHNKSARVLSQFGERSSEGVSAISWNPYILVSLLPQAWNLCSLSVPRRSLYALEVALFKWFISNWNELRNSKDFIYNSTSFILFLYTNYLHHGIGLQMEGDSLANLASSRGFSQLSAASGYRS